MTVKMISDVTEHLTKEQLILLDMCSKKSEGKTPVTTDDIINDLKLPKSTVHDILHRLENVGFVKSEKKDKERYYEPDPRFYKKFLESLDSLKSAYSFALERIRSDIKKQVDG